MNLPSQQRGASVSGIVLMISMAVVCIKLGLGVIPAQIGHYQLKKSLAWELKKANDNKESEIQFLNNVETQWRLNGYTQNPKEIVEVTNKTQGKMSVQLIYDESSNLFGNVNVVSSFDDTITAEDAKLATQ